MSLPNRPTFEYGVWDEKGKLQDWLNERGAAGFRLVSLSTNLDDTWEATAVMERRTESDADTQLMALNAQLLQSVSQKNDELRKRLDALESEASQ